MEGAQRDRRLMVRKERATGQGEELGGRLRCHSLYACRMDVKVKE